MRLQVMEWYIKRLLNELLTESKIAPIIVQEINNTLHDLHKEVQTSTLRFTDQYPQKGSSSYREIQYSGKTYYYRTASYKDAFENLKNSPKYGCIITESKQDE